MPRCSVEGCERRYYSRGWCNMHYQRVRVYGTPDGGERTHAPPSVRFWRGVSRDMTDAESCWNYVAGARRGIYGQFQPGGKGSAPVLAHRYSYELAFGLIPKGKIVLHRCDNPRCVNPLHLWVGTHKDNTQDMIAKGRHARQAPKGEASGVAVLTEADVRMIRASTETNKAIADRLGVAINTVRSVRIGRTWAHIP